MGGIIDHLFSVLKASTYYYGYWEKSFYHFGFSRWWFAWFDVCKDLGVRVEFLLYFPYIPFALGTCSSFSQRQGALLSPDFMFSRLTLANGT